MGSGWDQCRFVDTSSSLLEQLNCPICLGVMKDAMQLPCGHSFCEGCIYGLTGVCPIDRQTISELMSPNLNFRGLFVITLRIYCQFNEHCDHVATVENIEQHEAQCARRIVKCESCELDVTVGDWASHDCKQALKVALKNQRELSGFYKKHWEDVFWQLQEQRRLRDECSRQLTSKERELDVLRADYKRLEGVLHGVHESTGSNTTSRLYVNQIEQPKAPFIRERADLVGDRRMEREKLRNEAKIRADVSSELAQVLARRFVKSLSD